MNKKTILLLGLFLTLILFGAFSFAVSETQESCFVQEDGGWIYYLDDTDFGHLYKVKKDGTLKTKVYETSASEIIIVGDWIYYIKGNKIYHGEGDLYRVKKDGDGTEEQLVYKDEIWPVKDLEYSNGYITFYAGNMFKMSVSDLKVIDLSQWRHWPADNQNGYLIAKGRNYSTGLDRFDLYNLVTDEESFFEVEVYRSIEDVAYDDQWIYYLEDIANADVSGGATTRLVKVDYNGENRAVLIEEIIHGENLKRVDDYLYFYKRTEQAKSSKKDLWRVSLDGSDLELIVSESLSTSLSTRTISTVIDDNIYYTSKYYLASYDMENERFVYKYFPDYLGKKFAIFNDQGNVLYPGDKEIVELTPELVEKRRISDFKSIDGTSNELDHFRTNLNIYNSGDYLAIADFHNPDRIINLKDSTIYRVGQDSDQCLVVGLDSNYVYFTADRDEDYFYKLYRLPLGEYSMNKKEYLWDVLDVDIQNGYAIDIRLMGNKNEIWLYNLSTGDNRQVASTSSSEVFVDGNYLYYSSMMNGGLYKVPLSGGKAQRIIKRKGYIADFVLTNDSIYSFIWKDGLQLVEMGLNGENYRPISSDKLGVFYDINDRYFIFQGTEKWASFSLKNQTIELIGNLERNFEVKKAVEVKKDMVTEQK